MTRGSVLMALVFTGAFLLSSRASADAPRQSDIEACNKEAAAAATPSSGAPSGDGTTPMINGRRSAEQPAMSGAPAGTPSAATKMALAVDRGARSAHRSSVLRAGGVHDASNL